MAEKNSNTTNSKSKEVRTWYMIIDCNSFYASVEKVFRPELRNKPVVVLSNNDGVIVALSQEAKDIGLKRGDLFFKVSKFLKKHNVAVFSSNYVLYYDFSMRVEQIVRNMFPKVEKYSIDEMFVKYTTNKSSDQIKKEARELLDKIRQQVKIKVSIGIAPSKTLSKVMNRYAKKDKRYKGVAMLRDRSFIKKALEKYKAVDVWGIGRRHALRLEHNGITTAWEFSQKNDNWIKKNFAVTGLRTARELRGFPNIDLSDTVAGKKNIMCSRSFGKAITKLPDMKAAISDYVQEVSEKLRMQNSVCKSIGIFLRTGVHHNKRYKAHYDSIHLELPYASYDNLTIQQIAFIGLEKIFKEGSNYKKAGVYVNDLFNAENLQYTLWDDINKIAKLRKLYKQIDMINSSVGTISMGVQKFKPALHDMKQSHKSPEYTTKIEDVPIIQIDEQNSDISSP